MAKKREIKDYSTDPAAQQMLIRAEELSRIRSIINHLDEDEQELIRLRYVAELSFVEIGDLLGKREDAVKKSVYRLLARLKSELE